MWQEIDCMLGGGESKTTPLMEQEKCGKEKPYRGRKHEGWSISKTGQQSSVSLEFLQFFQGLFNSIDATTRVL